MQFNRLCICKINNLLKIKAIRAYIYMLGKMLKVYQSKIKIINQRNMTNSYISNNNTIYAFLILIPLYDQTVNVLLI